VAQEREAPVEGAAQEEDDGAEGVGADAGLDAQVEDQEKVSSNISSKKLSWLGISIPEEHRGEAEFEQTEAALTMMLMEMTDEERPDGPLDVPEKPVRVDKGAGKGGPHFYGFESPSTVIVIVSELGGKLPVDIGDEEVICNIFHSKEVRDTQALTLFAAGGFWMELYTKKSESISTTEQGARLVSEQLGVMISKAKWPRSLGAKDKSRLLIQASLLPHEKASEKKLPVQIYYTKGGSVYTEPFNYRVQADAFPHLCNYCHQPKETTECVCDKSAMIKKYEKTARDGGKLKANQRRELNKDAQKNGKEKTSAMAAKIARLREFKAQQRLVAASAAPMQGETSGEGGAASAAGGADLR